MPRHSVSPKEILLELKIRNSHPRISHLRSSHLRSNFNPVLKANKYQKKIVKNIKMLNLSLKELKLIAKNRTINGYKKYLKMNY